jgi:hypothetical protein
MPLSQPAARHEILQQVLITVWEVGSTVASVESLLLCWTSLRVPGRVVTDRYSMCWVSKSTAAQYLQRTIVTFAMESHQFFPCFTEVTTYTDLHGKCLGSILYAVSTINIRGMRWFRNRVSCCMRTYWTYQGLTARLCFHVLCNRHCEERSRLRGLLYYCTCLGKSWLIWCCPCCYQTSCTSSGYHFFKEFIFMHCYLWFSHVLEASCPSLPAETRRHPLYLHCGKL